MDDRIATGLCSWLICLLVLPATLACAQTPSSQNRVIRETEQGQVDFSSEQIGELSGISYLGEDQFAVVSDNGGKLALATIKIDRASGSITSAMIDRFVDLEEARDVEDLALGPEAGLLLVVDESRQSLATHDISSGKRIQSFEVPNIFKMTRPNLGFESVAISLKDRHTWVANEEPLKPDGPRATKEDGALVRLQRFNPLGEPASQFAYRVDPHRGSDNIIERAQSGVSGLVSLPNGGLIVMERELGGSTIPTFRIRLYLIDTNSATDTSELDTLNQEGVTPVRKQLLFESNTGPANFEGITLGPQLDSGDYTLILVSDNGGKYNPQNLMTLIIKAGMVQTTSEDSNTSSAD